jgi:hypothetical protein
VSLLSALSPQLLALACFRFRVRSAVVRAGRKPLSLSVRASRHRPKACKTTPFPFLLDFYPSRILFCPLCSRRSNRQTFPPLLPIAFSPYRMTPARTFCTLRFISLVTGDGAGPVVGVLRSNPAARAPESRSFFKASPAHFLLALRLWRGPCGPFGCCLFLHFERTAKTRMALHGVRHLAGRPADVPVPSETTDTRDAASAVRLPVCLN